LILVESSGDDNFEALANFQRKLAQLTSLEEVEQIQINMKLYQNKTYYHLDLNRELRGKIEAKLLDENFEGLTIASENSTFLFDTTSNRAFRKMNPEDIAIAIIGLTP